MKGYLGILFVLPVLSLFLGGCAAKTDRTKSGEGRFRIVATTGMVGDAVKTIAGDKVSLTTLMGPGVDPHLYKATKGDVDNLDGADLIFYNGLHLEAKMADILKKMGSTKRTVAVAETIPESLIRHPSEFQGYPDPHVWFDVSLWKRAVEKVAVTLMEVDTLNQRLYRANWRSYSLALDSLHEFIKSEMVTVPEGQRVLITAHDAFGYFGQAYSIEVRGLQGISTVTEAGLYDVTSMIDFIVERKIKAVFVESSVPRKAIDAVVEGCHERGHNVKIGGELFSDAMGTAGTPKGTYLGMVRHNVETIVNSLK